jgi:uncharacterized protein
MEQDTEWAVIKEIEAFSRRYLGAMSHGFDHTRRVYNLALVIGNAEKADLKVLLAAALLHDIGRDLEDHIGADHAEASAFLAEDFLKSIDFPKDKIKVVLDAIRQHRFSSGEEPGTLEARVLADADNLDALGAIGVARAFTYGGKHERDVRGTIDHFNNKLLKLKDFMFTKTAKQMAEERHRYTEKYLERLQEEIEGYK